MNDVAQKDHNRGHVYLDYKHTTHIMQRLKNKQCHHYNSLGVKRNIEERRTIFLYFDILI